MRGALPLMVVATWGVLSLILDAIAAGPKRDWIARVAMAGVLLAACAVVAAWADAKAPYTLFYGMLQIDRVALLLDGVFLAATLLVLCLMTSAAGEAPALMLFSLSGMMMIGHAGDLVTVFLGIETMTLPVYILCGLDRTAHSSEAAVKYFLLGAFATGFLLYGIVLVYGATGTTSLATPFTAQSGSEKILLAGLLMLTVAFAFKVAAVPFHMWAPDVYEGAPTPVAAFMASGVKAGGFAALLRVFGTAFSADTFVYGKSGWGSILAVLAAFTMVAGNVAALKQDSVKRLLAWSSIAHAGYLLVGVVALGAGSAPAQSAVLYYLAAYAVTTIGAFGLCHVFGFSRMADFAGLGQRNPAAALAMTIFLLSLAGVPPTAGFFGKLLLFQAALEEPQLLWLVIVGVLTSVVSIYYYLRIVVAMYVKEPIVVVELSANPLGATALFIAVVLVLQLGLFPQTLLSLL